MKKIISCVLGMVSLCGLLTMTSFANGWEYDGKGWLYNSTDSSGNPFRVIFSYVCEYADGTYSTNWDTSKELKNTYMIKNGYMVADEWIPYYDGGTTSRWRYFDSEGKLVTNGTTPDGYTVDKDGFWYQGSQIVYDEAATAKYWAMHDDTTIIPPTKQPATSNPTASSNDTGIASSSGTTGSTSTNTDSSSSTFVAGLVESGLVDADRLLEGSKNALTGFWGSDDKLTYAALKHLYSVLKDPTSLKVKDVHCITYDSTLGSGEDITSRAVVITYYAKNSFGALTKGQYSYAYRNNGSLDYGDYTKTVPYNVLEGDYRDVRNIDYFQDLLNVIIAKYWG